MKPSRWLTFHNLLRLFVISAFFFLLVFNHAALGEDVVIFDGHPLGEESAPDCFGEVRARPYTIRAATFVFEWPTECAAGDVTYEIVIERDADSMVLLDSERVFQAVYGRGEPDWSEQSFSGVCAQPCPSISMQVDHPWHESAIYWFDLDIRAPLEGGGSIRLFGSRALVCKSNGVLAQCQGWSKTIHVPDSAHDIPHLEIIPNV